MRGRLPAAAGAAALAAGVAPGAGRAIAADVTMGQHAQVYADDDATTVTTTLTRARAQAGATTVEAALVVDVVSSASVDVVSAATGRFRETRLEGQGGGERAFGPWRAGARYRYSSEPDWRSHTAQATVARALASRAGELSLSLGAQDNRVGRASDESFSETLRVAQAGVGVEQALTPAWIVRGAWEGALHRGFESSPYRYVHVADGSVWPERHPDRRVRHAFALRSRNALGRSAALAADYRLYTDTWGVQGHTLDLGVTWRLSRAWQVRARDRVHWQDGADFYRERYHRPLRYLSADRELSDFVHNLTGVRIAHRRRIGPSDWSFSLKADHFWFRFFEFAPLPRRQGVLVAGAVEAAF